MHLGSRFFRGIYNRFSDFTIERRQCGRNRVFTRIHSQAPEGWTYCTFLAVRLLKVSLNTMLIKKCIPFSISR